MTNCDHYSSQTPVMLRSCACFHRPSWDDYFLGVALAVAARGDCTRSQVGAVLVDDDSKRILSTGYNGVERGKPGCLIGACPRGTKTYSERGPGGDYSDCIGIHAEDNLIRWWVVNASLPTGPLTTYITRSPCDGCLVLLRDHRISSVVYPGGRVELEY
jgi:dCMP deaminase